ncbi:hypothetical protein [Chitinimonas sp.]|uniref:hypothetical protein n=1 Tax=Chitinimonas sp. TaxID=1934313 RepID=UPI0035B0BF96
MSRLVTGLLSCSILLSALPGWAEPHSTASEASAFGSALVVAGSAVVLASGAELLVKSVEHSGQASLVVLESAASGMSVTLELSGKMAEGLALASGATVQVVSEASGHLLVSAGKVLAFVPNELGKGLLHHSKARS